MNLRLIGWGLAGVLAAFIAGGAIGWWQGDNHGRASVEAKHAEAIQTATETARETERENQREVNRALQNQLDEMAGINAGLAADLERLRQRPDRRVPGDTGTACKGAAGAELSGPDAAFLARLSARADELRAALRSCYLYADTLIHHARKRDGKAP